MTIPVWVLMAFAFWTLITLLMSVGIYRWSQILTKRLQFMDFRADQVEGSDFYCRAMRAHMNCIENLPVYGALVLVIYIAGIQSQLLNALALILLAARILQTLIHLSFHPTNTTASFRFLFFFTQVICMFWMGIYTAVRLL